MTGTDDVPEVDAAASDTLRDQLRRDRGPADSRPFFDRGPGYATLSGGATSADVDWLVAR